jgi:hypothetical protein
MVFYTKHIVLLFGLAFTVVLTPFTAAWGQNEHYLTTQKSQPHRYLSSSMELEGRFPNWAPSSRSRHYLLPGTSYGLPIFPDGFDPSRELMSVARSSRAANDGDVLRWIIYVLPTSKWDFKEPYRKNSALSSVYADSGNFWYGMTGRAVGFDGLTLDIAGGIVNQATYLYRHRLDILSLGYVDMAKTYMEKGLHEIMKAAVPYYATIPTAFGDDPADLVSSQMGQEYYSSGQYILDFLYPEMASDPLRDFYVEASERLARQFGLKAHTKRSVVQAERQRQAELPPSYSGTLSQSFFAWTYAQINRQRELEEEWRERQRALEAAELDAKSVRAAQEAHREQERNAQEAAAKSEKDRQEWEERQRQIEKDRRERENREEEGRRARQRETDERDRQFRKQREQERQRQEEQRQRNEENDPCRHVSCGSGGGGDNSGVPGSQDPPPSKP